MCEISIAGVTALCCVIINYWFIHFKVLQFSKRDLSSHEKLEKNKFLFSFFPLFFSHPVEKTKLHNTSDTSIIYIPLPSSTSTKIHKLLHHQPHIITYQLVCCTAAFLIRGWKKMNETFDPKFSGWKITQCACNNWFKKITVEENISLYKQR